MFISASEAVHSEFSTDGNSDEAMPAIMSIRRILRSNASASAYKISANRSSGQSRAQGAYDHGIFGGTAICSMKL
ncbi:hypothetical protein NQ318_005340 [Aromia moschata]|uniref:Uncharacterized protein n=1 Tax=Aromia moschata TaxID=1265417 RepID=A0AAV8YW75_9CUCU|nr:hypothetical protein NQ318_005340 [Aromia moschata]